MIYFGLTLKTDKDGASGQHIEKDKVAGTAQKHAKEEVQTNTKKSSEKGNTRRSRKGFVRRASANEQEGRIEGGWFRNAGAYLGFHA